MNIPTRAGREAVERLTEAEATTFINNDKETIKTELNRLTFVPLAPRPAEAPAGPNHLAERLKLAADLDEARRNLEEQVAERAVADSAANAAFNAVEAERDAAVAERDAAVAERDRAVADRDAAMARLARERDEALAARDAAVARADELAGERDAAVDERDAAVAERDAAVAERDAAVARAPDALAGERDALTARTSDSEDSAESPERQSHKRGGDERPRGTLVNDRTPVGGADDERRPLNRPRPNATGVEVATFTMDLGAVVQPRRGSLSYDGA